MAILFITSNRIGDAVLSTGLLNRLLEMYPNDGVFVAAGGPSAALFEATPRLIGIHAMAKQPWGGHWLALWRAVADRRWRAVLDVRRSALPYLVSAAKRYSVPKAKDGEHRVVALSRALGDALLAPTIWTDQRHEAIADAVVGTETPVIAIAPTANWIGKTWPADRFAALARRLTGPGGIAEGARVMIVGAEPERAMAQPLFDALPTGQTIDAIGIGLLESYTAIKRSRLFVGNDSGLMHLAAASGVPTVGLFGPSDDRHYAPWGPNGLVARTPLSLHELVGAPGYDHRNPGCQMEGLLVDTVADAIAARWPSIGG